MLYAEITICRWSGIKLGNGALLLRSVSNFTLLCGETRALRVESDYRRQQGGLARRASLTLDVAWTGIGCLTASRRRLCFLRAVAFGLPLNEKSHHARNLAAAH